MALTEWLRKRIDNAYDDTDDSFRVGVNTNMPDTLSSGTIAALGESLEIELAGHKSCTVTVSGTWVGTLIVESSTDNQVTWVRCWLQSIQAATSYEVLRAINSFTANNAYAIYNTSGITHYRVIPSAWTSGTANVKLTATEAPPSAIFASTSIIQNVLISEGNSSVTNLASGATFTGTAISTLGVNAVQITLKTDQNCTIYIDQSPDGTNWDVSDSYDYYGAIDNFGITVQAVNAYTRTRVTNEGSSTSTYFRLQTVLCPMAAPLPRSLTSSGRLKTCAGLIDDQTKAQVNVSPLGSLKTIIPVRLVGTSFGGTTKDTNFWTETVTGTGSVTQAGELTLATGTTANSTVQYDSVRLARKVSGTSNQFRCIARLVTAAQADNVRRVGAYDDNDGFFFQVNGTTFGVGSRKATVDTIVNSGSFNGNIGDTVAMDTTIKRLVIEYTSFSAKFFVNDVLLHTISSDTTASTNTLNLPIRMENNNINGNTTNNSFLVRLSTILRLGELQTLPTYKFISTNTTTICKYGAGTLQRIVNVDNAGTVAIYDNTAASGTVIASVDTAKALGDLTFDAPFNIGLTVVTAGGAKITVVYE